VDWGSLRAGAIGGRGYGPSGSRVRVFLQSRDGARGHGKKGNILAYSSAYTHFVAGA